MICLIFNAHLPKTTEYKIMQDAVATQTVISTAPPKV